MVGGGGKHENVGEREGPKDEVGAEDDGNV